MLLKLQADAIPLHHMGRCKLLIYSRKIAVQSSSDKLRVTLFQKQKTFPDGNKRVFC